MVPSVREHGYKISKVPRSVAADAVASTEATLEGKHSMPNRDIQSHKTKPSEVPNLHKLIAPFFFQSSRDIGPHEAGAKPPVTHGFGHMRTEIANNKPEELF